MEKVKRYLYRFAIITGAVVGAVGYAVTWDMYNRIEDLEKQIHVQEQRLQQYETMRDQVKVLEQRVSTTTELFEQYESQQMNGNGYLHKTLENYIGERRK